MCFLKIDQIFLKGQCQPILSLIQVFQKILEKEIKHEFLMEIYKESLRGQYRSDCTIFWWLMKNLWKDNMDWTILSFIYLLYPGFYKIRYIARFKGRHSSGADNTVHSVQMDNLVHKDNTSWSKINLLIFVYTKQGWLVGLGQAGWRGGCLKKGGGARTLLQTMHCSGVFIFNFRGIITTMSNIYNGVFLPK